MKEYLKKLPKEILDLIYLARDTASSYNMPVYLVGGFVRDLILGARNLDLDIAVEGDGIKFAEAFAKRLKAKLISHKRFGTATVILGGLLKIDPSTTLRTALSERSESNGRSRTIDIATCRKEFYPEPGHLPIVSSSSLKDDLFRRDFTINALGLDIGCENFGALIDFFGGKADIKERKIRVLHNLSFQDDPTRILRAIRFEQRYAFRIEQRTLQYLKQAVKLKMLEKVEPQRIRDDLILMLKEARPIKAIERLYRLAGFNFISPRFLLSEKSLRLIRSIEKETHWFKITYPRHRPLDTWLVYFMGLTDSLNIRAVRKICRRFVFRKGEEKRILLSKKVTKGFIAGLRKEKIRPSGIFTLLEPLSYEVIILIKAKFKHPRIQQNIESFFKNYHGTRTLITGHDLRRFGVVPGPDYQGILAKVLKEKLDSSFKSKEQELSLLKQLLKPK